MTVHQDIADAAPHPDAIKVRVGTPEDIHACMDIAELACRENALVNANPQKLLQHLWAALNMQEGIVGIIGEPAAPIEGIVLLRIGPFWYSDDRVVEEKVVFVRPEYRSAKGGRAVKLCRFSMAVSDKLGLPLTIGVLSTTKAEAKVRMYNRLFGEPAGAYWIYNGKTGLPAAVGD